MESSSKRAPIRWRPTPTSARCAHSGTQAVWTFGAYVDDADGLSDIIAVETRVYDEVGNSLQPIAIIELREMAQPGFWDSVSAPASIDCSYSGYTADFFAFDHLVISDGMSVWGQPL